MHAARSRMLLSSLAISFVVGLGVWPASAVASAAGPYSDAADLRTPAGAAVSALVGPDPAIALSVLPADFEAEMGYRPVLVDGAPTDPAGDCSSPVPLPGRFEAPCKVHDFGYDLLRLAARNGTPLGGWARVALDRMLGDRMHRTCSNPACDWAADLAHAGVAFNTWRQRGSAPVAKESTPAIIASSFARGGEEIMSLAGLR
ncbi:hypothetical protein [Williamsia soli]|uniref:hypothetical protein n=1 Tax=Williamsia soli TaxID=364929 RepID=UPI001F35DF7A|nr:hypothetical protein [Williamsia soli]